MMRSAIGIYTYPVNFAILIQSSFCISACYHVLSSRLKDLSVITIDKNNY